MLSVAFMLQARSVVKCIVVSMKQYHEILLNNLQSLNQKMLTIPEAAAFHDVDRYRSPSQGVTSYSSSPASSRSKEKLRAGRRA